MHNFAAALGDVYFQQQYKRGVILRFNMDCDDPNRETRYKFGVVLNKNASEEEALLAITTSNQAPFASGYLESDIVRVNAGDYPCFDKPTILSLREIRPEPVAHLKELCKSGQLTFHGELTEAHLTEVLRKVGNSRLIEGKYKKRIV